MKWDKTLCANHKGCQNLDCLRKPQKGEVLENWSRINWADFHQPRANLYCASRKESEPTPPHPASARQ